MTKHFLRGNQQRHGSWENMGACVARIQNGFFHFPTILPADWLQDVDGEMWISGESTALSNWSPLRRQPHNPSLARTPVASLLERGLASTAALHQVSITIHFHRWTLQLGNIPLVALPRDVSASEIAILCKINNYFVWFFRINCHVLST